MLKAPQARPSASNALQRLGKVLGEPQSPGASRLAEANRAEQARRHAEDLAKTASAAEAKRREDLYEAAVSSFSSFWAPMRQAIVDDAPLATVDVRSEMAFIAKLKNAQIGMSMPLQEAPWTEGPFDVIASAVISVVQGLGRGSRAGRSHSLWYCDAQERGSYQWFETAFMASAFGQQPKVVPFSLDPAEAGVAFSNVIGTVQLAWPLEQLDRDDPDAFIDRWIGWFADAANGEWQQPSLLPERPVKRSWRDSNRGS
ncbi:hypothetical protein ACFVDI_09155 [Nocardioides sp. NPDC057767]|uniref:hypothetical protein n=1 Tax=unclassified Nocardioides TaxID=2615069 RepID=UPI00366FB243